MSGDLDVIDVTKKKKKLIASKSEATAVERGGKNVPCVIGRSRNLNWGGHGINWALL